MWNPRAFATYAERFPDTPALGPVARDLGAEFVAAWASETLDADVVAATRGVHVVFLRGFLGNWMPGNLVAPTRALRALGVSVTLAATDTGATVEANVARLARSLPQSLPPDGPLLLCGHSKGGLECLHLADTVPAIGTRVVGVLMSQTPRGPSAVLESLLLRAHATSLARPHRRAAEALQRAGLHLVGATPGGHQLTAAPLAALLATLDARPRPFPVWQTASWSSRPTAWLDSFHERLGEIRPGCAHDGQFYLEDLVWPGLPHLLLPHLDHAQPAMGGFGFDHVRYWKALIARFAAACGGAASGTRG